MAKLPEELRVGMGGYLQFLRSRVAPGREDASVDIDITNGAVSGSRLESPGNAAPSPVAVIRHAESGRFSLWLRAIDSLHRTSRSPFVVLTDVAVAFACGFGARAPVREVIPLCLGLIFAVYISGKYADRASLETQGVLWFLGAVSMPLAIATLIATGFQAFFHWPFADTLKTAAAVTGGLFGLRAVTWLIIVQARRRGLGLRRTLIVGDEAHAALIARKLEGYPEAGLVPVATLSSAGDRSETEFSHARSAARLSRIVLNEKIEEVVLAPHDGDDEILTIARAVDGLDPHFSLLPPLSEVFLHPGLVTQVGGVPLIPLGRIAQSRQTQSGKRLFDLCLASIMLIVASPLLALTAIAIKVFEGGPVIYRQRRVGRAGKPFELLKFRSMIVGAERLVVDLRDRNANTGLLFKVHDDPRITPLGRLIRRLSIDELPQLWNVIRGEMSLVGPRPLPVEPEDFGPIENKRHIVLPGITGYWQIAGCNDLTYEEMIKLDLAYIQNRSLFLDLLLLLRTPAALIHRRGPW